MGVFYKEVSPCQMKNRDPWLACHSVLLPMPTSKVTARVQISKWLQGSLKQAHTYTYPVAASIQAE